MHIFGIGGHIDSAVDAVDEHLQKQYPNGIVSMLIELPQDFKRRMAEHNPQDYFFLHLANRWEKRGTKIIPGDTALRYFPPEAGLGNDWYMMKLLASQVIWHPRDVAAIKAARRYDPPVALFGSGHADRLKLASPDDLYTRVEIEPKTPLCKVSGVIFSWLNGIAVPDEIVHVNLANNTTRREVRGSPNLVQSVSQSGLYLRTT